MKAKSKRKSKELNIKQITGAFFCQILYSRLKTISNPVKISQKEWKNQKELNTNYTRSFLS